MARLTHWTLACATLVMGLDVYAQESTLELRDAERVDSTIRVEVSGRAVRYALDDAGETFPLDNASLFLASRRRISLRYPNFNPLKLQVSVSEEQADDPSDAQVTQLLEALLRIPALIAPAVDGRMFAASGGPGGVDELPTTCTYLQQASNITGDLAANLYAADFTAAGLRTKLNQWVDAIDDNPGGEGIEDVAQAIEAFRMQRFRTRIGVAEQRIEALATLARVIALLRITALELPAWDSQLYNSHVCGLAARALVSAAQLSGLRARLEEVVRLDETLGALGASLKTFVDGWRPIELGGDSVPHYELATVQVDGRKTVTLKAARINYATSEAVIATTIEDMTTSSFVIRRYNTFTPEIGAGVLFSGLRHVTFGTAMNEEGETVVAVAKDEKVSFDAAVTVNFVCQCRWRAVAPMLQVGALTDTETPAVIVGGGLRLFGGRGRNVALSGGGVFGWVKELSGLSVGDVVDGTKSIEEALALGLQMKWYGGLLFSF